MQSNKDKLEVSHKQAYLSRTVEKFPTPPSNLKRGMLVEAKYRKADGTLKQYVLLILDENFEGYVHALSLEHVKPEVVDRMARKYGVIPVNKKLTTFRHINIPKLYINKTPQQFYTLIKEEISSPAVYNKSYRTFLLTKFSGINVMNYRFAEDIEKKFTELEW